MANPSCRIRVGLISDTHGLLRPQATAFLEGCDHIIHAGDIGNSSILDDLAAIAPLTVVRGNNDQGAWAAPLREIELLEVGEVRILVVHDLAALKGREIAAGVRVVVSGHSHKPAVSERDGVLHVNPGSAGRRRFKLPISLGELSVEREAVAVRLVEI